MAAKTFIINFSFQVLDGWIEEGVEYCIVEFIIEGQPSALHLLWCPIQEE